MNVRRKPAQDPMIRIGVFVNAAGNLFDKGPGRIKVAAFFNSDNLLFYFRIVR